MKDEETIMIHRTTTITYGTACPVPCHAHAGFIECPNCGNEFASVLKDDDDHVWHTDCGDCDFWREVDVILIDDEEMMDEMLNEATGVPHYECIIDSIQEHLNHAQYQWDLAMDFIDSLGIGDWTTLLELFENQGDGFDVGSLVPQDILLNAIRYYGKALEKALKDLEKAENLNEAMKKSLREYLDIEHGWC